MSQGGAMRKLVLVPLVAAVALLVGPSIGGAVTLGGDTLVNVGSPPAPFSQNKQNEPALAADASMTNVLVAGATRADENCRGFEAIAASRTVDVQAAASGDPNAWSDPVVVSRQSSTTFSDKEQIWADNAQSSKFFGTVYLCWSSFRGQEKGHA